MRRDAGWTLLPIALYCLSAVAQQPSAPTTPAQAPQLTAPGPRRQQPPSGRRQGPDQRSAITNADVIRMVKAGVPESAVINSIQSSPAKFDLSPDRLLDLHRAGVGQKILEAMMAKGGAPSDSGVSTDAQTGAGNSVAGKPGASVNPALQVKLGPAKIGPQVRNPRATQVNTAISAVLQKQRSAADIEAAQMKLSIRPQGQAGTLGRQSQLMSVDGGRTTTPVMPSQSRLAITDGTKSGSTAQSRGNPAVVATNATIQKTPAVGSIGSGQTSSATSNSSATGLLLGGNGAPSGQAQAGNGTRLPTGGAGAGSTGSIPSSIAQLHYMNTTALTCTNDPTFRILTVSGSSSPATFTPIDQYNLYTITGCSFGNPGSSDKVYIYGTGSFQGNFAIKFWSDNSIVISLDESITGYPDLSNLSLVVQRYDGQQTQKQGFKFYATRQTVPLSTIPSSWVKLVAFPFGFSTQYSSPGTGSTAGTSYMSRASNGIKFDPTGQRDYYDFSQLAAGWTTDSFQLTTYAQSCPYVITYNQNFGTWDGNWDQKNPNNIRIWLSDTTCSGILPPFPWVNYQNWTGSYYALQVWVNGPRGVDPLTNQPGP